MDWRANVNLVYSVVREGTNKVIRRRGYTDQGLAEEGHGDNKREWAEDYTDQEPAEGGEAIVIKGP